jgi:hypothetical protein
MKRASLDEMRDALIAEKTAEHIVSIRAKVSAGESPIALIADGVTDLLCNDALAQRLVRSAVCLTPHGAGVCVLEFVEQVIADQAEVEAIKEVERMERDRQESADEARIGRAAMDRAMSKYPQPMRLG